MNAAVGKCTKCEKHLVYVVWRNGKRLLVIGCPDCNVEMHFDLETLEDILGEPEFTLEKTVFLSPGPTRPQ